MTMSAIHTTAAISIRRGTPICNDRAAPGLMIGVSRGPTPSGLVEKISHFVRRSTPTSKMIRDTVPIWFRLVLFLSLKDIW